MPTTTPPPPDYVRILNEVSARPGETRPALHVRARVEWETGVEVMEVWATRYDPRDGAVFVELLHDPRCQTWGAWLARENIEVL